MTDPLTELGEALTGQYAIESEIGRGGMGIVYRARDLKLDRLVAIKVLPPVFERDPAVRERFLREARTAASLSHPNIVPIYRADEIGEHVFFAMAYVDGESLGTRLGERGTVSPALLVPWLADVARALDYAHARSVIHRDVKAENILIDRTTGRALLTDFGIARVTAVASMTATGQILGTVWYMSPEQVMGDPLDGRSDLYALGVVAFRALAGRFPFECDAPAAILVSHATKPAPPLLSVAPRVPSILAAVVDRCLAKDPAGRYRIGAELAEALEAAVRAPSEDSGPLPAVLSETDAQALWKRAAELQAATGRTARPPRAAGNQAPTSGYRIGDVLGAAAEAGIGDEYVARAAAELGIVSRDGLAVTSSYANLPRRWTWGGAPNIIAIEATVPREATDAELDAVIEHIRPALRLRGNVSRIGRSLTWSSRGHDRRVDITLTPRGGKTTIRVDERLGGIAGGLYGGIVGGMGGGGTGLALGLGLGVFHAAFAAVAMAAAMVAGSYGIARTIFTSVAHDREQELRRFVQRIADELAG